jgi:hypothetical protein
VGFSSTRLYTCRGTLATGNSSASRQNCVSFRGLGPGMDPGTLSEGMNFLLDINLEPQGTLIVDQLS